MIRVVAAPWVLPGLAPGAPAASAPAIADGAVALEGDRVRAVGPRAEVEARFGRAEPLDAVLLPALVNAHLHLELSHMKGWVAGGEGLPAWIQLFVAARRRTREGEPAEAMGMAAEDLVRAGVAAVGDIGNSLDSLAPLAAAGLGGTIFHEVFGFTPGRFEEARAAARQVREAAAPPPGLRVVESPHAIYSTNADGLRALLRGGPGSLHLAEDPAERAFCATESAGAFGRMYASLGAALHELRITGRSPVDAVKDELRPHHLAVHCVDLDDEDLRLLAATGATVVLCPRSNRYILGALPRLEALLAAGIPLAVGTDSLASAPSLAPLAELALLRREVPAVSAARLLPLAWNGAALGAPHVGRLAPGAAPGVLAAPLEGARPPDPAEWLVSTFGAEERPFTWLARQRPGPERPE
ncbi:amidohydrolase family protein [Anaeromyxobacter sp. Red801]|uniref:amidohydrolase family protein n=1 Tax=Anaeromyxobacter sp. Red801 TaxID=3411632 RepID=UPI003B9EA077